MHHVHIAAFMRNTVHSTTTYRHAGDLFYFAQRGSRQAQEGLNRTRKAPAASLPRCLASADFKFGNSICSCSPFYTEKLSRLILMRETARRHCVCFAPRYHLFLCNLTQASERRASLCSFEVLQSDYTAHLVGTKSYVVSERSWSHPATLLDAALSLTSFACFLGSLGPTACIHV